MWLSYKQLLHLIFPPSADEEILMATNALHFETFRSSVQTNTIVLLPYRDRAVRAAIHLAKFHHHPLALERLGAVLADFSQGRSIDLIVPIPLSARRERARGYNQVVEIVCAAQQREPTIRYNRKLLVRTRHTTPQTELAREARQENLAGAFAILPQHVPPNIHECNIVLLDDVVTTGNTMRAARAALAPLQPKSITCVALAG